MTNIRSSHVQQFEKEMASKQEQFEQDPDAAAQYMNQAAVLQAGIDMWSQQEPDILGLFVIWDYFYMDSNVSLQVRCKNTSAE
jgi:hypothetical protein